MDKVTANADRRDAAQNTPEHLGNAFIDQCAIKPQLPADQPGKNAITGDEKQDTWYKYLVKHLSGKAREAGLHDWLMVVFTFVLTIVACLQGCLVYSNSTSSTDQMNKVIDSANRIDDAADSFSASSSHISKSMEDAVSRLGDQAATQKQQTVGTLAAVLVAETPRPTPFSSNFDERNLQGANVYFANAGKVHAKTFVAHGTMTKINLPTYRPFGSAVRANVAVDYISPYDQVPPGLPGVPNDQAMLHFDTDIIAQSDMDRLQNLQKVIQIRGESTYNDGFDNTIGEHFCFIYAVLPKHNLSDGASINSGEGNWARCDDIKRFINIALKWKK